MFVLILFLLIGQQCTASISDCPISHSIQLTNPYLGLPLEFGKCESCGTSEPGQCEGQFLYFLSDACIYITVLFDFS
jgi:DNA-directed RNA polymerase-5 subunit 1